MNLKASTYDKLKQELKQNDLNSITSILSALNFPSIRYILSSCITELNDTEAQVKNSKQLFELSDINVDVESGGDKVYVTLSSNDGNREPLTNVEFAICLMQAARNICRNHKLDEETIWSVSKQAIELKDKLKQAPTQKTVHVH